MPSFNQYKEDFRDLLLVPAVAALVSERIYYGHLATLQTDPDIAQRQGGPASFPFPFPAITIQIQEGRETSFVHQFFPVIIGCHSNKNFDEAYLVLKEVFNILKNVYPDRKKFNVHSDQTPVDFYERDSRLYHVFQQFRVNRVGVTT